MADMNLRAGIISTAYIFYFCVNAMLDSSRYGDRDSSTQSGPPSARTPPEQFRVDLNQNIANTYQVHDFEHDFVEDEAEKEKA